MLLELLNRVITNWLVWWLLFLLSIVFVLFFFCLIIFYFRILWIIFWLFENRGILCYYCFYKMISIFSRIIFRCAVRVMERMVLSVFFVNQFVQKWLLRSVVVYFSVECIRSPNFLCPAAVLISFHIVLHTYTLGVLNWFFLLKCIVL